MPKKMLEENYVRAFYALYGDYVRDDKVDLYSSLPNPEQLLLRKESYTRLSAEAKEMISIIVNAPSEVLEMMTTPRQKRVTIKGVRRYFATIWMSTFITDITIKEVSAWVSRL